MESKGADQGASARFCPAGDAGPCLGYPRVHECRGAPGTKWVGARTARAQGVTWPQMSAVPRGRAVHGEQLAVKSQGWVYGPVTHIGSCCCSHSQPSWGSTHSTWGKSQNRARKRHTRRPHPAHRQAGALLPNLPGACSCPSPHRLSVLPSVRPSVHHLHSPGPVRSPAPPPQIKT